ncbi:MAG TPA: NAD-dependent epimerase/dehydratase family protein [Syntrophomonadaceae bacterium]|nr:NAD-dependent epimerase/dehydratase family protein [Syntrophomonadaceae bacterium]
MKRILVTGAAGFIGSRVAGLLLDQGYETVGIDNLNDYYDVELKLRRLAELKNRPGFYFYPTDIENYAALNIIFELHHPDAVINLAARAGVRYSLENPFIYLSTNAMGTLNLLDLCRAYSIPKFILASTSSLYAGQVSPFNEDLPVNTPISPYAASKKAAEAMAYSYHYSYGIDVTILRYFTVYGPAGRPDMSIFIFIKQIIEGHPLTIFGDGLQSRNFTYVDDIARGTVQALLLEGYEVINLGNNHPAKLMDMVHLIEKYTSKQGKYHYEDFHKADIKETWADIGKAQSLMGWKPATDLDEGIKKTVAWFEDNWSWVQRIKL